MCVFIIKRDIDSAFQMRGELKVWLQIQGKSGKRSQLQN